MVAFILESLVLSGVAVLADVLPALRRGTSVAACPATPGNRNSMHYPLPGDWPSTRKPYRSDVCRLTSSVRHGTGRFQRAVVASVCRT